YKIHLTESSPCGDHCIKFGLSNPSDDSLQSPCSHEHILSCDRCLLFPQSIVNLRQFVTDSKGIQIKRYDFSESQCGKSYCDSKITHLRSKIRQYASNGKDVKSAADMKKAIDSVGGVGGCQAAYVDVNLDAYATWVQGKPWKGISKIYDIEFG
ncbi:hypothetical protein FSP39_007128, partial [Pinctada imbricata]